LVLRAGFVAGHPAEGIATVGGAQDGAAQVSDAAHLGGAECDDTVETEQAFEASQDAVALAAPLVGAQHDGTDDGVKSGGVAPAGGDSYAHRDERLTSLLQLPRRGNCGRPPTES